MKRVLMFGWEYPPEVSGGLGIATHGLLMGLAGQGAKVKFVLPRYKEKPRRTNWEIVNASRVKVKVGEIMEEEYWEKITYVEVGSRLIPYVSHQDFKRLEERKESGITRKVRILKNTYEFDGGYGSSLNEEVTRFALVAAEIASSNDFDVVHAHDWMTYPAAITAGAKAGKPIILHVHSTELERSFPDVNQEIYDLERKSFEQADHLIAVSQLTKDTIKEHYQIADGKISVIHNSISPEFKRSTLKSEYPSKNPTVTFLGRMARQKAPSLWVDVAKTLSDRDPDYRFVMAGEGHLLESIKHKVSQLNLQKKFSFPGFLSASKVKNLLQRSDVFLMPASSEPFGMVASEAAYCGVPVVLSRQTGASEVMPSAITFECWETFKMANAIEDLINHPKETLQYTRQVQKEVKKQSWDKAAKEAMKVYHRLNGH